MRGNRIEGVHFLNAAPDDDVIRQAKKLFQEHAAQNYDGLEVWDGSRFVYRQHVATEPPTPRRSEAHFCNGWLPLRRCRFLRGARLGQQPGDLSRLPAGSNTAIRMRDL
jgi:hypothetical protein